MCKASQWSSVIFFIIARVYILHAELTRFIRDVRHAIEESLYRKGWGRNGDRHYYTQSNYQPN